MLDPTDNERLVAWLAAGSDAKKLAVGQEVTVKGEVKGTGSVFQECLLQ